MNPIKPRPCVACNRPTTAQSTDTNGPRCLDCGGCEYRTWKVCDVCGVDAVYGFYRVDGKHYCRKCYAERPTP